MLTNIAEDTANVTYTRVKFRESFGDESLEHLGMQLFSADYINGLSWEIC